MIKLREILQSEYIIFFDMDGVLTDFEKQFKKIAGMDPESYKTKYGEGKLYAIIDKAGVNYWAHMDWMPGAQQMWSYMKKYNPIILSSPTRSESSRLGKKQWVKQHLPNAELILAFAKQKPNYSKPNRILIDDKDETVREWINRGGIGIYHVSAPDTIKKLQKMGF